MWSSPHSYKSYPPVQAKHLFAKSSYSSNAAPGFPNNVMIRSILTLPSGSRKIKSPSPGTSASFTTLPSTSFTASSSSKKNTLPVFCFSISSWMTSRYSYATGEYSILYMSSFLLNDFHCHFTTETQGTLSFTEITSELTCIDRFSRVASGVRASERCWRPQARQGCARRLLKKELLVP